MRMFPKSQGPSQWISILPADFGCQNVIPGFGFRRGGRGGRPEKARSWAKLMGFQVQASLQMSAPCLARSPNQWHFGPCCRATPLQYEMEPLTYCVHMVTIYFVQAFFFFWEEDSGCEPWPEQTWWRGDNG